MQSLGIESYSEYLDYLEVRPDEFPHLFNTILINVTSFLRDPAAWAALQTIIEKRLQSSHSTSPIRVWSAGCASGEEPFTIAIMLADILGLEQYAERVKIYATDVDDEALGHARVCAYPESALESLPEATRAKYFTHAGPAYIVNKELRRGVIFGRHNLVQDAPISRIDLLVCRNTLMYFNAETQTRVLNRMHFALNDDGILLLGKAEMLLTHADLFTPLDLKLRLFSRTRNRPRERATGDDRTPSTFDANASDHARLCRAAFDRSPTAQVVIDSQGRVAFFNHRATQLFCLTPDDAGRPFHDLEASYRPTDLRSCLDRVRRERRPIYLRSIERKEADGTRLILNIEVVPLIAETGAVLGIQMSFADVTESYHLDAELRKAHGDLKSAQQELQSTSEELETTNEELQSTVEELETTNEELQSTNEELETMNEELQSTVEELQSMNDELRQRTEELVNMSSFFGSVLGSMRSAVAVLDRDLLVRVWNPRMEELWGLRASETHGKPFVTLDIGLPIDQVASAIRSSLSTGAPQRMIVSCTNRRGKPLQCTVEVTTLQGSAPPGVTLVIDELAAED